MFDTVLLQMGADEAPLNDPAGWVHLIPSGSFSGRDGRGPYILDADAVLSAFDSNGADLPVDYEHQSLSADEKSGPVPAAGWISALECREDGIWGRVSWTLQASGLLADKAYRYLSPVFRFEKRSGRVVALTGAGLVHSPNLFLQAAASQGDSMDELLERLVYLLNLPAASTAEDVVAELQKVIGRLSEAKSASEQAAQALAVERERQSAEFVPLALHADVAAKLKALEDEVALESARRQVDAAQSAGKLPPAMRDWAMAYCKQDPNGFARFVEGAPRVVSNSAGHGVGQGGALSESDREAMRLLGIAEGEFLDAKHRFGKE